MMPVRGLSSEEISLPKTPLSARHGIYFSAAMMCMWDNIHGPKVLNVWTGDEPVAPLKVDKAELAGLSKDKEAVEKLSKDIKEQLAASRVDNLYFNKNIPYLYLLYIYSRPQAPPYAGEREGPEDEYA